MIQKLRFKFGKSPDAPAEEISPTPVTVFVGPNNSGKSKLLSEIHHFCESGQKNSLDVVLDGLEFRLFSESEAEERVAHVILKPNAHESLLPEYVFVGKGGVRDQVNRRVLLSIVQDANSQAQSFCQLYLRHHVLMLDGQSRIRLVDSQSAGDLQQPAYLSFQVLFRDDSRRAEVRRIIYEAFGTHLVVDPTNLGQLRLRLSPVPPNSSIEERGIHEDAVRFHAGALPIEQASDGVKAFTGMITETIAGDPAILLIDEPEAFLHPSLAFQLGKEISRASLGSDKRLFVATHSANFVMGCIQSGVPVNIVRLTYRDGTATTRVLPSEDILRLMRNPLLRSTGVLSGLFYEFVVVTEADSDRAFYQEINERLQRFLPELGIPNCLFINAQNKQTVRTIVRPLRELGIPTAGIVDIDVLKDGGSAWTSFLESAFVPDIERSALSIARAEIKQRFDKTGKDMKRAGGIQLLAAGDREAATNLLERLAEYGLFVVPKGELESWLQQLETTGHGSDWLIKIFEKMGEDPASSAYLKPTDTDVWAFLGSIKRWLTNAKRKGIPV